MKLLIIRVYGYVLVSCIFNTTDFTLGSAVCLTYVTMFSINQYHKKRGLFNWSKFSEFLENMSALCWIYGRKLYDYKGVPLGLVASSWGGTRVEAWSSPEALAECDA